MAFSGDGFISLRKETLRAGGPVFLFGAVTWSGWGSLESQTSAALKSTFPKPDRKH